MTDELKNRTWAILPIDFKREVKKDFNELVNCGDSKTHANIYGEIGVFIHLFGVHNLTAEEQPKSFNIGDKVRITHDCGCNAYGLVGVVVNIEPNIVVDSDGFRVYCSPKWLEPYIEPEGIQTEDSSPEIGKDSTDSELNFCELLAGCEGMEFYSKWCGKCCLKSINPDGTNFTLTYNDGKASFWLLPNGKATEDGELMLFPSKDVRTWEGWQPYEYRLQSESKKYENIRERDAFLAGAQFAEDNLKYVK